MPGTFLWPADDGWPYPDAEGDPADLAAELDVDLMSLKAASPHLFDGLDERERTVIVSHYGLGGQPPRTMKQLHAELGMSRSDLRAVLGSGLSKLRANFGR